MFRVVFPVLWMGVVSIYASSHQTGEYTIFQKNDKKGLRNSKNKIVIPAVYEDLGWSSGEFTTLEGVLGYKENGLWGLINLKNQRIIPSKFTDIYPLNLQYIVASIHESDKNVNRFGVIDLKGQPVLDFEYGQLKPFHNLIIASMEWEGQKKFGLLNSSFQESLPFLYQGIEPVNGDFAVIDLEGKKGLINQWGQVILAPKYQQIKNQGKSLQGKPFNIFEVKTSTNELVFQSENGVVRPAGSRLFICSNGHSSQLIDHHGKVIQHLVGLEIEDFQGDLALVTRKGLYGIMNTRGEVMVPVEYQAAWLHEGFVGLSRDKEQWKVLGPDLKPLTMREYQSIRPPSEGLLAIKRHGNWGFINSQGEEVVPPQYEEVKNFSGGAAQAFYSGSWGIIDTQGNWLIKPRYDHLERVSTDTYLFQNHRQNGLVNEKNQVLYRSTNPLYSTGSGIIEKHAGPIFSLKSLQGEALLSPRYQEISVLATDPNYYHFKDSLGQGLYNITKRSFLRNPSFQEIRTISEGFISVRINNQYGFVDENGLLRIANRYEDVGVFNETMSPVKIRNKWGYIDRLERLKIQPVYDYVEPFVKGLAVVGKDNKYGLVNTTGQVILPLNYDKVTPYTEGRYICQQGKRWGLVNDSGKVLLYPKYDHFTDLENGFVIVTRRNKYSLITDQGVSVIPMIYDRIEYDRGTDLYLLERSQPWEKLPY